jgi:EamA domain-containing membrane protein RarD
MSSRHILEQIFDGLDVEQTNCWSYFIVIVPDQPNLAQAFGYYLAPRFNIL